MIFNVVVYDFLHFGGHFGERSYLMFSWVYIIRKQLGIASQVKCEQAWEGSFYNYHFRQKS